MNSQGPSLKELISAARLVSQTSRVFNVDSVEAASRWYQAMGFTLLDEYSERGEMCHAQFACGNGDFSLSPRGWSAPREGETMRFVVDGVERLYEAIKQRQPPITFEEELHELPDGGRQFSIRDLDGVTLIFSEPA